NGFFGNPNTLGLIAMLVFFPLMWLRQRSTSPQTRRLLLLLIFGWAALIVATGSRGSFVGAIAGGFIFLLLYGSSVRKYIPWLALGALFAIAIFVILPDSRRVLLYDTENDASIQTGGVRQVDRPFLIQRAIELGMRSPIYGVGFGASDRVFNEDIPYLI